MNIQTFATLQRGDRVKVKGTPEYFTVCSEPYDGNIMIDGISDGKDGDGKVYPLYYADVVLLLRDVPDANLPNTTPRKLTALEIALNGFPDVYTHDTYYRSND